MAIVVCQSGALGMQNGDLLVKKVTSALASVSPFLLIYLSPFARPLSLMSHLNLAQLVVQYFLARANVNNFLPR